MKPEEYKCECIIPCMACVGVDVIQTEWNPFNFFSNYTDFLIEFGWCFIHTTQIYSSGIVPEWTYTRTSLPLFPHIEMES